MRTLNLISTSTYFFGVVIAVLALVVSACQYRAPMTKPIANPVTDTDIQSLDQEFLEISDTDFTGGLSDQELGLEAQL